MRAAEKRLIRDLKIQLNERLYNRLFEIKKFGVATGFHEAWEVMDSFFKELLCKPPKAS
jgi:hypothetical protein